MKLDNVEERQKVIDGLIKKSFKLDKLWLHDKDNLDDWVSNMEIMKNLFSVSDMIRTEIIFIDTFGEMESIRARNIEEKEVYLSIVFENMTHFVDTLLLRSLEYTFDTLEDWKFKTEVGQKYHKDVKKKIDALIKKYQDLYDL